LLLRQHVTLHCPLEPSLVRLADVGQHDIERVDLEEVAVPAGSPLQASGTERSFPWQVYAAGIAPPGSNAVDVSTSAMSASSMVRLRPSSPHQ